jgi:predicted CXXCH cytochrome family protein
VRRRIARRILVVAAAAALALGAGFARGLAAERVRAAPAPAGDSCTNCHNRLGGRLAVPAENIPYDAHTRSELRCAGCHGGDPSRPGLDAMDPAKGFRGKPRFEQIPGFCGRCHADPAFMRRYNPSLPTDQLAHYRTSQHGLLLAKGDRRVAVCISCHGVHPVRPVNEGTSPVFATNVPATCARCHSDAARMKPYGIPTTQHDEYRASVHGQALLQRGNRQAPACNDCHGNHGAAPPGVTSVANVCAQCHSATRDLFVRSRHKSAYDALGLAECTVCHGTHKIAFPTDAMLGREPGAVCTQCHAAGSAGLNVAVDMRQALEDVKAAISEAEMALGRAANAGMDVGDARLDLDDARTQLIRARAVTHTANRQEVRSVTAAGVGAAGRARAAGEAALAELLFRRRGLGVFIAVIGVVAVLLWLKLQELRRTSDRGGG